MPKKQSSNAHFMLTAPELAKKLRISKTLLYELKAQGKLPLPTRLGRRILWPAHEIEQWVKSGCPAAQKWEILKNDVNFSRN